MDDPAAFTSPADLDSFVRETATLLERAGNPKAAAELVDIQNTAWTTGSEWLGELGLAIRRIKRRGGIPQEIGARLDRISRASRRPR